MPEAITPLHWEMFLRGAVAALLLQHVLHLLLPAPARAARWTLAAFAASVLAYVFCQQAGLLLALPRPLALLLLAGCVASTAWMWAAARALFDDGFAFGATEAVVVGAMLLLGLAANLPYFPPGDGPYLSHPPDSWVARLGQVHALAMLGFSAATLWTVGRGWRADLVASRRAARRWVAMGIGAYAALALVIELALRGQPVGRLLPALHMAGIGSVALALGLVVARGSLADVLGSAEPAAEAGPLPSPLAPPSTQAATAPQAPQHSTAPQAPQHSTAPPAPPAPTDRQAAALAKLDAAMREQHAYRREGLTLADLAATLGMAEAPLRELINQRLGFRNFNDFLHHHRLQEATARLATEDLPILTIALGCGYGSIGPFNRAFKQRLGLTPTEYRAGLRLQR